MKLCWIRILSPKWRRTVGDMAAAHRMRSRRRKGTANAHLNRPQTKGAQIRSVQSSNQRCMTRAGHLRRPTATFCRWKTELNRIPTAIKIVQNVCNQRADDNFLSFQLEFVCGESVHCMSCVGVRCRYAVCRPQRINVHCALWRHKSEFTWQWFSARHLIAAN